MRTQPIIPVQVEVYPGGEPLDRGLTITLRAADLVALASGEGRILQGVVDGNLVQIRCSRMGSPTPMAPATSAHGEPKRMGVVGFSPSSPDHDNEYSSGNVAVRAAVLLDQLLRSRWQR